jgi:Ca-activated chloride channel family protein
MSFLRPAALVALLLIPLYLMLYTHGRQKKRNYLLLMSGKYITRAKPGIPLLMMAALGLITLGLMRPVSNPRMKTVEQKGRNIVFVIDVSRSMLAQDLVPNRLERARYDILNSLGSLSGHRVALVAFAGTPILKCPLTLDTFYFSQALSELGTHSVSRGGTNLGDAVRTVIDDLFDSKDRESMDILLITDGEDQDSFPLESASRAGQEGIRIISIGLGSSDRGAPVPSDREDTGPLMYENQPVYSKADMQTLTAMANASDGGWSVAVEDGKIPIQSILNRLDRTGAQRNTGSVEKFIYDEHYRWFLIPGLFCLILAFLMETTNLFRRKPL